MDSSVNVSITISGDSETIAKLNKLEQGLNFRSALDGIGHRLTDYFSGEVFTSMGGAFGTPWKALSPRTMAFKSKHFREFSAVPLQATQNMRRSFRHKADSDSLTIYNKAPYFKYHQSTEPRHKIPRRPMMAVNGRVKSIIQREMKDAISELMRSL